MNGTIVQTHEDMQGENIQEKTFHFAVSTIRLVECLREQRREYILSKQILRSGTAIGALVREAQNAESKPDFIHKLSIAQKECDETKYWLELLKAVEWIDEQAYQDIYNDATELLKIIRTIIMNTKNNSQPLKQRQNRVSSPSNHHSSQRNS